MSRPRGLSGGTVTVAASDRGAGVSYAGDGLATPAIFYRWLGQDRIFWPSIAAARHFTRAMRWRLPTRQAQIPAYRLATGATTFTATTGSVDPTGGRVQGAKRDTANAESKGGVTVNAAQAVTLETVDPNEIAILFASDGDLVVTAGTTIVNTWAAPLQRHRPVFRGDRDRQPAPGRPGRQRRCRPQDVVAQPAARALVGTVPQARCPAVLGRLRPIGRWRDDSLHRRRFGCDGCPRHHQPWRRDQCERRWSDDPGEDVPEPGCCFGHRAVRETCQFFCTSDASSTMTVSGGRIKRQPLHRHHG